MLEDKTSEKKSTSAPLPSPDGTPRDWREIAADVASERDPERMIELCKELDRALEQQRPKPPSRPAEA